MNEEYEEHRQQNKTIEMKLLSSKNRTNESIDSSEYYNDSRIVHARADSNPMFEDNFAGFKQAPPK